jgi:Arc/MetJ-type ribon-helix-helix transcriptional regulator
MTITYVTDGYLVTSDTRRYSGRMARPKKFARRIMVRFDEETLAALQRVMGEREDRSDFVRAAVELETAIRSLDVYADLKAHLLANESVEDFCAKAVRRAVQQRKATLAQEDAPHERIPGTE